MSVAASAIEISASGYAAHCCQRQHGASRENCFLQFLQVEMHGIWIMHKLSVHAQA